MKEALLVLNAGSSSLKFAVFGVGPALPVLLKGSVSRLAQGPRLKVAVPGEAVRERDLGTGPMPLGAAAERVFAELQARGLTGRIAAAGHRIVHGGREFREPTRLDEAALGKLRRLASLAPLHQPYNLDIVGMASALFPRAVQVGAFDTAFHADRPRRDRLYALPRHLADEGILAYGFHGLSYAHAASVLRQRCGPEAGRRAIVAHLGSGASLCAMDRGQSVATTMGFSALEGLVMGSRCGSLDPGVVLHLIQERGMSAEEVRALLYEQSGLLGVSGLSSDMQVLLQSADPRAREAIELFVHRIGRCIGSLAAAIGGLNTLVFTAGIGENAPRIRQLVGDAAGWLGVEVDPARNEAGEACISTDGSRVMALVIPADEERAVAEGVMACLGATAPHGAA